MIQETSVPDDLYYMISQEENEYWKEIDTIKDKYRQQLKNLVNIKKVYEWLDTNDGWNVEGVFSLKITFEHNGYYNRMMPHAKIDSDKFKYFKLHRQKEDRSECGVNHIFIHQSNPYEDSYNGIIAIPLKDFKYLVVSYYC